MPEEKPVETVEAEEGKPRGRPPAGRAENVVFVGRKPVMSYVVACLTLFNAGHREVVVKARGSAISTAVDSVELLRRAFARDVEVRGVEIGTEEVTGFEGRKSNVSTMEISLVKAASD